MSTTQIAQNRIHGLWLNCISATPSTIITFKGTALAVGSSIISYEWSQSNPRPSISGNTIIFAGSGLIWNIYIYSATGPTNYMLYCCEGSGTDLLNKTIHNGYATNTTDHFLINSETYWSKAYRDDVYKYGWSTKTGLSLTTTEHITNGTFTGNVNGWTAGQSPSAIVAADISTTADIHLTSINNPVCAGAYQQLSGLIKIFRYEWSFRGKYTINLENLTMILSSNTGYWNSSVGWTGTLVSSYLAVGNSNGISINTWFNSTDYTLKRDYISITNPYLYLTASGSSTNIHYFDNVSLKVYEDGVKIPSYITDRSKDCLGNTLTP